MSQIEWLVSLSGEIGTKRPGTQRDFIRLIWETFASRANILGLPFELGDKEGRFLVKGPSNLERLLLSHFGLGKVARLFRLSPDHPKVPEEIFPKRPFTYVLYLDCVRSRHLWSEAWAFKKKLLAQLEDKARKRLEIAWDNHPPERLELRLEVKEGNFWLLVNPKAGPGGLPVGSGEKVLLLFSGGPDSLLAGYLLGRRGQEIGLIFFDDEAQGRQAKVKGLGQALAYFFPRMRLKLWVQPYRRILEELARKTPKRERCLFCKRLMLHLAIKLAEKEGFSAVATGEILGEQASQTLPALSFLTQDLPLTILRPVLTFTKEEILQTLEKIGLREEARVSLPKCPFSPKHPYTKPRKPPAEADRFWSRIKKLCPPPKKMVLSFGGGDQ